MIEDYIFMDEDGEIIDECGYWNDEAAENECERLCKRHGKKITCYKEICHYEPDVLEPRS